MGLNRLSLLRSCPAIARIDRLSQTRSTEGGLPTLPVIRWVTHRISLVFCYYAKGGTHFLVRCRCAHHQMIDTIEKNILDLAARQGLSLYTKENSAGNLTNAALASTTKGKSGQKGDFISRYATLTDRTGPGIEY